MTSERGRGAMGPQIATNAWRDAMEAMIGGYTTQWRQMTELLGGLWGMPAPDGEQAREGIARITQALREVTEAQTAVASESLRMPFWLTGGASPTDLQAAYFRLFEAQRELFRVYLDLAVGWQRAQAGATQRAAETAQRVVDTQVQTARRVANDAREVQQATVDAARTTTAAAQETAARAAEQTRQAVEESAEQA